VESLDHNAESRAIIQAITGLAGSLAMDTTAEGVETDAQLQALRDKGAPRSRASSSPRRSIRMASGRGPVPLRSRAAAMARLPKRKTRARKTETAQPDRSYPFVRRGTP
jgi:EAL domain-containing protein (putative c-di-GMP-specific phosphodiesterase class I)